MLVDSHCHLQFIDYTALGLDLEQVLNNAKNKDIEHLLCVATELDQHEKLISYAQDYSMVSISAGVHPNEDFSEFTQDKLLEQANNEHVVAIGETGLDYYRDTVDNSIQKDMFTAHIEVALDTKKSLIIHTRQARKDTIDILTVNNARDIGGVLHCFTEDWDMAKKALDLGFYISFSGIVTFKNAKELQDVAKKVPLDRILVETDSPYLAPVPMRGKINQPANVRYVAEFVADLRGDDFISLSQATTENYYKLFRNKTNKS